MVSVASVTNINPAIPIITSGMINTKKHLQKQVLFSGRGTRT